MRKKDWLKLDQVQALVREGLTDKQIGAALEASPDTVKHFRGVHGLPCNPEVKAKIGPAQEDLVRRLAARGFSDATVGRVLGVGFKAVFEARRRMGVQSVRVIGPDLVKQVRKLVKDQMTDNQIGAAVGRSVDSVRRILRKNGIRRPKSWRTQRRANQREQ